jgi:hypothetical protein
MVGLRANLDARVVGVVFIVAGVAKVLRQEEAAGSIWRDFASSQPVLAPLVVLGEIVLGCLLLLWRDPGAFRWVAIGLLSFFSALLVVELGRDQPRLCGCMGALLAHSQPPRVALGVSLAIDVSLLAWMGWTILVRHREHPPRLVEA